MLVNYLSRIPFDVHFAGLRVRPIRANQLWISHARDIRVMESSFRPALLFDFFPPSNYTVAFVLVDKLGVSLLKALLEARWRLLFVFHAMARQQVLLPFVEF